MAIETILGGALGGILRLAPEVLNYLDRKNLRKHELAMADKHQATEQVKTDGEFAVKAVDALSEGIKVQGQQTGIKFVDGWNSIMRPLIATQWVVLLYPGYLLALWHQLVAQNYNKIDAFVQVFGMDEKAICSGIITFFFLNRVIAKATK